MVLTLWFKARSWIASNMSFLSRVTPRKCPSLLHWICDASCHSLASERRPVSITDPSWQRTKQSPILCGPHSDSSNLQWTAKVQGIQVRLRTPKARDYFEISILPLHKCTWFLKSLWWKRGDWYLPDTECALQKHTPEVYQQVGWCEERVVEKQRQLKTRLSISDPETSPTFRHNARCGCRG